MKSTELLIVEDHFQVPKVGLVLAPSFSVPLNNWTDFRESVIVVTPDGNQFETNAAFTMTHFHIVDVSVAMDKRWRIMVSLTDAIKDNVPIGSTILVSAETKNAIITGSMA